MNFRKTFVISIATILMSVSAVGLAQAPNVPPPTVSISANGIDVRNVLHDLFGQAKQNYVIEPSVRYSLYLNLDKVDFDEALAIVCHLAKLHANKQDGIYYVGPETPEVTTKPAKPKATHPPTETVPPITQATLRAKHVTTRLAKSDIRKVFALIAKQSGLKIVVDPSVPACKLDAFLEKTTLKYALDQISGAAKLHYRIVDAQSILVFSDDTENRVVVTTE